MDYDKWYQKQEKEILADLFDYLRFKSVSARPEAKPDLLACAEWLVKYLEKAGLKVELWHGSGHPTIFAERIVNPKAPTVLCYGHYDVQPEDPVELWQTAPFEPTMLDEKIYCRGVADNKGLNFMTIQAIRAFLETSQKDKLNLKILIEGEEEMGSATLGETLEKHKDRLKADHLLIVDMGIRSFDKPALAIGSRGIMTMDVSLKNMDIDVHSGALGGVVLNPLRVLCEVLAKAVDNKGKVTIPGFYKDIQPMTPEEKARIDFSFDRKKIQEDTGVRTFFTMEGKTPAEANYIEPIFEINGMWGGYTGAGFKTVIPREAHAKLSARLVPHQDPKKIYEAVCHFIRANVPKEMELTFHYHGGGGAIWGSPLSKTTTIMQEATKDVLGSCDFVLAGGSIPITTELVKYTKGSFAMPGTGLDSDAIHAPNEHFSLKQFKVGYLIMAKALTRFAEEG
ncbi:MAG: M20/M25/M40 family metallo-hydrolase [Verrucomicrobia bacterium]|nr:M20/M25/M40 family metallo-hydrolase [Verrucomicrobiota bacterium]